MQLQPDPSPPWLMDVLCCPACSAALSPSGNDELRCAGGHAWPVVRGVPTFVPGEKYTESFGFQWNRFNRVQLDDESRHESAATFAEKTGLRENDVRDKLILDVGCGMGRFSDVVSRWGGRVVGVDLSAAVFAARGNLAGRNNVAICQADVFELPFRERSFDIIFSIGVLHHTPSTEGAFRRLPRLLKPGGTIAIWVYARQLMRSHWGSELLRPLTRRMDKERLLRMIDRLEPPLTRLHRSPVGRITRAALPVNAHTDRQWRVLDTFDWYSPRYQWKHTYDEVEDWFRMAGLASIERLAFPVSVRGDKPA